MILNPSFSEQVTHLVSQSKIISSANQTYTIYYIYIIYYYTKNIHLRVIIYVGDYLYMSVSFLKKDISFEQPIKSNKKLYKLTVYKT